MINLYKQKVHMLSYIKKLLVLTFCFLIFQLHAKTAYEIPENIRHTANRDDASKIVYYFIFHINTNKKNPIAIICEGSSLKLEKIKNGQIPSRQELLKRFTPKHHAWYSEQKKALFCFRYQI